MKEISLEEINETIIITNFDGSFYHEPFTPPIESLRIIKHPNHCNLDQRNNIRKRIINQSHKEGYFIDESLYFDAASFLLDKKIPPEEKKILCKYLDEKAKRFIFEQFIKTELKSQFKLDPDDIEKKIWYTPRINNVPIKYYYINKGNVLGTNSYEVSYDEVEDFLLNISKDKSSTTILIAVKHLLNDSGILSQDWCPEHIKILMNNLNNDVWEKYETDLCKNNDETQTEYLKSKENKHNYHTNAELKKAILSSIPEEYNQLEKAIYIYSKLCQLLSYDPIYYIKESDNRLVANIENYDLTNNGVVCYEFSYILADLLNEIGINNIKEMPTRNDNFEDQHANILFLVNNLVIFADSTRSVIEGDLTSLKYSTAMTGIRCELYSKEAQEEFRQAKEKVKKQLKEENKRLTAMLPNKEDIEELSVNNRIVLINKLLTSCSLTNTDFISYANKLIQLLELNISLKLYYDANITNRFLLQIILPEAYTENDKYRISYIIDTTTKRIYDTPTEEIKYKEQIAI